MNEKINEKFVDIKGAFDEVTDKLHLTNKARHTFEMMVGDKDEDIKGFMEQIEYRTK